MEGICHTTLVKKPNRHCSHSSQCTFKSYVFFQKDLKRSDTNHRLMESQKSNDKFVPGG